MVVPGERRVAIQSLLPAAGALIGGDRVDVHGRWPPGAVTGVRVNGHGGAVDGQGAFLVADVPLHAGVNTLELELTLASGEVERRRWVVASGHLPVRWVEATLRVDSVLFIYPTEAATVHRADEREVVTAEPSWTGHFAFRLLDSGGGEVFRAGLPGSEPAIYEHVSCPPWDNRQVRFAFPDLSGAARLEILDDAARRLVLLPL
ncbi:MAG: hypothetical protein IT380_30435 [Myxococcales bacterium]|nr:hypothetical protein [Myxococcales bacterium]